MDRPDKLSASILALTPFNLFGLDRIYVGCEKSGVVKAMLFVSIPVANMINTNVAMVLLFIYSIWWVVDLLRVLRNIFTLSPRVFYCDSSKGWANLINVHIAYWFALFYMFFVCMVLAIMFALYGLAFMDEINKNIQGYVYNFMNKN